MSADLLRIKKRIEALTLADKFRLVAMFLDAGAIVDPSIPLNVARIALAELEDRR